MVARQCASGGGARTLSQSLLESNPELWDTVFPEPEPRLRWLVKLARQAGGTVLDVGCATGTFCAALQARGVEATGVDLNGVVVRAARRRAPELRFHTADMRKMRLGRRFRLVCCLGSTFSYNLTNTDVLRALAAFRRHLAPGGSVVIDVLNAIAFAGPRPLRAQTRHVFALRGVRYTATLQHALEPLAQTMTEQVTWRWKGQHSRGPINRLRLFFPQELAGLLERAGFRRVQLFDGYGVRSKDFSGRRLVAVAR